jgi:hypothetical protein
MKSINYKMTLLPPQAYTHSWVNAYSWSDGIEDPLMPGFDYPTLSGSEVLYQSQPFQSLSYIEFKDSINLPRLLVAEEPLMCNFDSVRSGFHRRKPRPPVYKEPHFNQIVRPFLKIADETIYKILLPKIITSSWKKREEVLIKKREKLIKRLNYQRYLVYEKRLRLYEANVERRQAILNDYNRKYKLRMENYVVRLKAWNLALSEFNSNQIKPGFGIARYTKLNPYTYCALTNKYPDQPLYMSYTWDSAWQPGTHWLRNMTTTTLLLSAQGDETDSTLVEGIVESIRRSLILAADSQDSVLIPRLFNKLASAKVDVGNLIAERHQSISLLKVSIQAILTLLKGKRSLLDFFKTKKAKDVADSYLAFKFGIQPLISDYESLVDELSKEQDFLSVKVKARRKAYQINEVFGNYRLIGKIEIRYMLSFSIDNQLFRSLKDYGFVNPLSIAWELTPWSFVFDWVYPIGKIIEDSLATVGLTFSGGTRAVTFIGVVEQIDNVIATPPINTPTGMLVTGGGSWQGIFKFREVLTTMPEYTLPQFKNPLSWTHGFEALALLIQRMKK